MNETVDFEAFRKDLIHLIGRHGLGKESYTPCDVLADLMIGSYHGFCIQIMRRDDWLKERSQKRPCTACACEAPEPAEDENEETNERGYIVYRHGKRPNSHRVFVEWRDGIALFANNCDVAMTFKYRGMAERVAEKLGKRWEVIDLDELAEDYEKNKRLLAAIFGETDTEEENG